MKLRLLSILCLLTSLFPSAAQDLPNLRINFTGGYSYFLHNELDPETGTKFVKDAAFKKADRQGKWGLNAEGNIHYLFNNGLGIGAKYRFIRIEIPQTDLLMDIGDDHYGVLSLSEKDDVVFLAPSLMYARWLDEKGKLLGTGALSVGYAYLDSRGSIDGTSARFNGDNIGFQVDLGVDYFLTRYLSAGISTGYFYAKIKEVRINLDEEKTTLPEDSQPNISNLKLNVSLSFNF